jgi:hypothetical protein
MNIYYDNEFLLTLYAYLRQTDLSIDRGLSDKWEKARSYLKDRYLVDDLVEMLSLSETIPPKKLRKVFCRAFLKLRGKQYMTYHEVAKIRFLLKALEEAISDESPKIYALVMLRLEIANASELVRKRINSKSRRLLADNVEHYNQHYHGKFYTIEQIVSGS